MFWSLGSRAVSRSSRSPAKFISLFGRPSLMHLLKMTTCHGIDVMTTGVNMQLGYCSELLSRNGTVRMRDCRDMIHMHKNVKILFWKCYLSNMWSCSFHNAMTTQQYMRQFYSSKWGIKQLQETRKLRVSGWVVIKHILQMVYLVSSVQVKTIEWIRNMHNYKAPNYRIGKWKVKLPYI